jgi:hypothetical protein
MKKLQSKIERACREIFPEREIYLLFSAEIPEQYRPQRILGFTGRGFDLILREQIGRRWCGRGSVIVLSEHAAAAEVRWSRGNSPQKIWTRRELWKAAAHELAHVAGRQILPGEISDDAPDFVEVVRGGLASFCADPPAFPRELEIPWADHDAAFFRLALHAAHRIRAVAGEWLPGCDWFNPRQYGLCSREEIGRASCRERVYVQV